MKYKIEIWRYHALIEEYQSDTIQDIYDWFYNYNWKWEYELGNCCFNVYEDEREMTFNELNKHGFYD